MEDIKIEDYTEKSFVVRGETRKYLEHMKKFGGKWNSSLTDKKTGEKFGAWIFPSMKKTEIKKWIENKPTTDEILSDSNSDIHENKNSTVSLEHIYNILVSINQRLEKIESKLNISKSNTTQSVELYSSEWKIENDIDDDVPIKPMKRLLGGK